MLPLVRLPTTFAVSLMLNVTLEARAVLPIVGEIKVPFAVTIWPDPPPEGFTVAVDPLPFPPLEPGAPTEPGLLGGAVPKFDCGVTELDDSEFGPVPAAFMAATLKVYVVPLVRPVTVSAVALVLNICGVWGVLPIYGVIMYAVIWAPPSFVGAVQIMVAVVFPGDATTLVGAFGTVDGTTGLDSFDTGPTPAEVIAATLKV